MGVQSMKYLQPRPGETKDIKFGLVDNTKANWAGVVLDQNTLEQYCCETRNDFCYHFLKKREYCNLAVIFVAEHYNVPIEKLMSKTRQGARTALARQIAMYLAHTTFSVQYLEVGTYFQRDRTTIAHACRTVEDQRDNRLFDEKLSMIEGLLEEVVQYPDQVSSDLAQYTAQLNSVGEYFL